MSEIVLEVTLVLVCDWRLLVLNFGLIQAPTSFSTIDSNGLGESVTLSWI